MKKKKYETPQPYAAETKDARFAGTFEVLIPVDGRNKPLRAPRQFDTMQAAESWLHSPDGKDTIAEMLEDEAKAREK
jgi:antibiotic biosynthesis monooxygenase (ABM) superfamily enzyme